MIIFNILSIWYFRVIEEYFSESGESEAETEASGSGISETTEALLVEAGSGSAADFSKNDTNDSLIIFDNVLEKEPKNQLLSADSYNLTTPEDEYGKKGIN